MSEYADLAQKLKPYILPWLTAGGGGATSTGGMAAHTLSGSYHTGQLAQSQATWAATVTALNSHANNVDAHHAQDHVVATTSALGPDHTVSGLTSGQVLKATGATTARFVALTYAELTSRTHDILSEHSYTGGAALDVFGLSAANTLAKLTPSSNPGGAAALLKSTGTGGLTLVALSATTSVNTPLLTTTAADGYISPNGTLRLEPTGDVIVGPGGGDMHPLTNYATNLGLINRKWLTLHAAELWVETLVAQDTIATIGGRILVGPTTVLTVDLAPADTTITVKHNEMASGDRVYMEADGKVEFMAITSAAGGSAGAYTYSVTRNLDGTGANQWYAGDAMFNTGVAGEGFIDLYSLRGVKAATEYGPTIVGNIRLSDTYNDWAPRWAVGNLNGLYDYAVTRYGFAAGNPATTWIAADASNGLRIMNGSTVRLQLNSTGNLRINNASGTNVIALDSDGTSYFAGSMTLGTSGGIYQGTGTFASPTTGLKLWNDSGIGRIGGYNTGTLQWYGSTDGKFYWAAGNGVLDSGGIRIAAPAASSGDWQRAYGFTNATGVYGGLYGIYGDPAGYHHVILAADSTGNLGPIVGLDSDGSDTYPGRSFIKATNTSTEWSVTADAINECVNINGQIWADSGAETAPTYTFQADTNAGFFLESAGLLGVSSGGAQVARFNGFGLTILAGSYISVPYGSVGAPSYTFNGDLNTGIYNVTDNTIGFAVSGGLGMQLSTTSLMLGSTADSIARMRTSGSNTVADNGTLTIGAAFTGILFLLCPSDSSVAIYGCDGGATYEISDPEGFWTVTKDTATKHNVYVESGNLIIQNKRTASRVYHIFTFGTSAAYA